MLIAHGRSGPGPVLRIVERWDALAPPESVLESKLLRLIRREGLPEPVAQWRVRERGRVVARLDFAYPDHRVAIEADGYRWHGDIGRWQADLARRNALTRLGWLVLHFTWDDIARHPKQVAGTIRHAISGRSVPISGT
jgi:very-short-patch-repair endonuclease